MRNRGVLAAVVTVACGGGGGGGLPDASDAASDGESLEINDASGVAVTGVDLPTTFVGQMSAAALLTVRNTGATATGPIDVAITGDAALDFVIDAARTTCAGLALAPQASCDVAVGFRPTAAGARMAALVLASTPGGTHTVSLSGTAEMPDLHFNPGAVMLGTREIGSTQQGSVELRNDGASAVPLESLTVGGAGYTRGATTCGATLGPGASCDVSFRAVVQQLGDQSGEVTVTSGGQTFSAPVALRGARRITVTKSGTGAGTITSAPAGISCGATCTGLFEDDVTLTAAPGANSQLTSWSLASCGNAATCVVPADASPTTVTASFALTGSSSLAITIGGNAPGEVRVLRDTTTPIATCTSSCTVPVNPGDALSIEASTPSVYGGITGACSAPATTPSRTGVGASCNFTAQPGTANLTVTFQKDAKELWTRLVGDTFVGAAFDGSDNLIVGSKTMLMKLSPVGATLWSQPREVRGLATGPNDSIYVATATELVKLDGTGATLWTRTLATSCYLTDLDTFFANCVAVGSAGEVVVAAPTQTTRWDAAGTQTWTRARAGYPAAIGTDGIVHLLTSESHDAASDHVRLASATGLELTRTAGVTAYAKASLSLTATNAVVATSSDEMKTWLDAPTFRVMETTDTYFNEAATVVRSGATDIGWVFVTADFGINEVAPWVARRYSSTGTVLWEHVRRAYAGAYDPHGATARQVAGSASGRIAVVGAYASPSYRGGWIQVYAR